MANGLIKTNTMNAASKPTGDTRPVFYGNGAGIVTISNQIYDVIIQKLSEHPFESGGILGKNECGCIIDFVFDCGRTCSPHEYMPDTNMLNEAIESRYAKGISFCGIVHSHLHGDGSLSVADMEYAKRIVRSFDNLSELYIPVVVIESKRKAIMHFHVIDHKYNAKRVLCIRE